MYNVLLVTKIILRKIICHLMSRRTWNTLQAPAGTRLEVPRPERDSYQIHLKSGAGQIYVVLVNRDRDSEEPVVMQVSCNYMNMNENDRGYLLFLQQN